MASEMLGLVNETTNASFMSFEEAENSMIQSWFLMSNPCTIVSLLLAYLFIVLKFGPDNMKSRPAYNIKYIVMAYNVMQIYINTNIFLKMFTTPGSLEYFSKHSCHPLRPDLNPVRSAIMEAMHIYFVTKVLDLSDTIFFVLKKKQSHVTFLHVYHHTLMPIAVWTYIKYYREEDGVVVGFLNSFVHIVMYTYYFLAGLGPEVQKYLWWKKYITKLQLIQFGLVITWMCTMFVLNCHLSRFIFYLAVGNSFVFIYLFTDFYIKAYTKKNSSLIEQNKTECQKSR
uniref:Elongation of very long chain fatty acids protein n=1 Tax=Clastoptera arizonana TaxID=38151 RepID=A0A1B6CHU4_9HEMI